jgi:hypothetical protein
MARKLKAYVHVDGKVFAPGDTPPKAYADQITNPKAWTGADDPDPTGYGALDAAGLKAEIEKRNEGREDDAKLTDKGSKAILVAVLEADDAANSGN